ncbi:MAG: SRPBCC family protein [Desulfovibrionales bacterium]
MIYRLYRTQVLAAPLQEVWTFFSDPSNLCDITPEWLGFTMTCPRSEHTYAGQILTYSVRPFPGMRLQWVTEITHMAPPHFFVDEQRTGPYRLWHHEHRFRKVESGTEAEDLVHYILPLGVVGRLVHPMIRKRLEAIFDFRASALKHRFS